VLTFVHYVAYARVLQTTTTTDDDDRRQWSLLVWPPYTMCRRASNKVISNQDGQVSATGLLIRTRRRCSRSMRTPTSPSVTVTLRVHVKYLLAPRATLLTLTENTPGILAAMSPLPASDTAEPSFKLYSKTAAKFPIKRLIINETTQTRKWIVNLALNLIRNLATVGL